MTLYNMKVPIDGNSLYLWRQVIDKAAEPLNKGLNQQRRKFFTGLLPESFDAIVSNERRIDAPGTYVHPAVYPAHHPRSGVAHVNAGGVDMDKIAR
eukprot:1501731-Prymnesium_polylepis.1